MKYKLLIICIVLVSFELFAQETQNSNQNMADNIELDLDADLSLFEDGIFDEESNNKDVFDNSDLSDTDIVVVDNILIIIGGELYKNPNKHTDLAESFPRFTVIFSEIDVRRGDKYVKEKLDKKVRTWKLFLGESPYVSIPEISYYPTDDTTLDKDSEGSIPITLAISVEPAHAFIYWGGNAFAGFGYKMRHGGVLMNYLGANRVEMEYYNKNILFDPIVEEDALYSKFPLDIKTKGFGYWDIYQSISNSFMYGSDFHIGTRITPALTLSLGQSVVGSSTLGIKDSYNDFPKDVGLPDEGKSALSTFSTFVFHARKPLYEKIGKYRSFVEISVPMVYGLWQDEYGELFNAFDSYGAFLKLSLAYHMLLDQNVVLSVAGISNGVFYNQPYYAKANMRGGVYNGYLFRHYGMERLGSGYDVDLILGRKGASAMTKYGVMIFNTNFLGLETFAKFSTGVVANEFDEASDNVRSAISPGVAIFMASPVNIILNFGVIISGTALGQVDGTPVGFEFSVDIN